ncbi:MAG: hypothetical protein AAGH57_05055 [Pseudomonadota bacterium]
MVQAKTSSHSLIMLMASLPAPGPLFSEKQTPLSRLRLEARLRVLEDSDRAILDAVENALEWRCMNADMDDAALLQRVAHAHKIASSKTLGRVIDGRMNIRLCMAALRIRADGQNAPPADGSWGYGRWGRILARNWRAPSFGLDHIFPWIKEADRLLSQGDAYELERLVLSLVERDLKRHGALHQFDLEAVIIYVLRWSLIERWTRYNAEAASRRFSQILEDRLETAQQNLEIAA